MKLRRDRDGPQAPPGDLSVVKRAGRIAAVQASVALAGVLLVVGAVVFAVYVRVQDRQMRSQLETVAATADDVTDPPPGMELVMRTNDGHVSASDGGQPGIELLSGSPGFVDVGADDDQFRALVIDRSEGRVVAMLNLAPFHAGRNRLLLSLGFAELAGILASIAVVLLFTRRSVQPLAQALALQRRFIADASHELRAPLTVLHTRAQMLARHASDRDAHEIRREADALVADTRVLGDIVEDLLASATMSSGAVRRDRIDLAAMTSEVRDSMSAYAESVGVTLRCDTEGPAEMVGSEVALRRAVTSLVDNALAHEHRGGTVDLRVRRDGRNLSVAVIDDGIGIDPETMSTLFARFAHGDAHAGGRPSYGIGLALVREIAQAHGGDISVESTPGRGTTFTLTLPAAVD